jgi:hypothetical protein
LVTWPPEDISRVIANAYALRGSKGSDLLSRMGSFDLWRGNLAEMRGDSQIEAAPDSTEPADADQFLQTLAVSRAFDYLPRKCEIAIRLVYGEGRDIGDMANELDATHRDGLESVPNCVRRLLVIANDRYLELIEPSGAAPDEAARSPYHSVADPS